MNSSPLSPNNEPWSAFAGGWSRLGPPLRPCPEDLQRMHQAWLQSLPSGIPARRIDVLTLGVTPELALFPWAEDCHVTALDASEEMIRNVWPGDTPNRKGVVGNWLDMPLPDASFDLILTDTGLTLVAAGGKLKTIGAELRRVLRKEGRAVMRHFERPTPPKSLEALVQATEAGQLHNFHELKLRLLMAAAAGKPDAGIQLTEAYDCFQRLFPDREALAQRLGCDMATISTIEVYRQRDARYAFPTLAELATTFDGFAMAIGPTGHYSGAELCPVFSLTPKS